MSSRRRKERSGEGREETKNARLVVVRTLHLSNDASQSSEQACSRSGGFGGDSGGSREGDGNVGDLDGFAWKEEGDGREVSSALFRRSLSLCR